MKKLFCNFLISFFIFALSQSASAMPVIWSGNGHAYELISSNLTWQEARAATQTLTAPEGFQQGHLATFSDAEEENFVISYFGDELSGAWFGFTDELLEGEWRWIDGTPGIWQDPDNFSAPIQTAYTNWRPSTSEPNNELGEDYAVFSLFDTPVLKWNDLDNDRGFYDGYLVEYSPGSPVIPEPTTLFMFSVGITGLCFHRKSRLP